MTFIISGGPRATASYELMLPLLLQALSPSPPSSPFRFPSSSSFFLFFFQVLVLLLGVIPLTPPLFPLFRLLSLSVSLSLCLSVSCWYGIVKENTLLLSNLKILRTRAL